MFNMPSRRVLVAASLIFALIGFTARSFASHSWDGYHWARTSNPFTLKVGDNVSSAWDAYLDDAIVDWDFPYTSVLNLQLSGGGTGSRCRPRAGMIEVCSARYGWNGWLGIAQVWLDGVHITQAIARMNDTYFTTPTYDTPAWRRLVMCQEVAHGFGLDHQDESFDNPNLGSCMDYTSDPDGPPSNEHPNAHDYEQIEMIYAHLDGGATAGNSMLSRAMPPAMGQIAFDTPAQWGRLVRSSGTGRVHLYELDFGGGHKVMTHVLWADPAADSR
jgi:hypothetical protein